MADDLTADFDLMLSAGREAADLALSYFQQKPKARSKADGTAITDADLAVDVLLAARLKDARPHYGWLSEESAEHDRRLTCRKVWAVDPIDGTRAFIQGRDDWTVVIALLENGAPILSVIINPLREEIFQARRGGGAFLNGQRIAVSDRSELRDARISAADGVLNKPIWRKPWPALTQVKPVSLAYRLASVANGSIDAAFALGPRWDWDVAAGALLVTEAGGLATTPQGEPLIFNSPEAQVQGFLAAAPNLHHMLIERLEGASFRIPSRVGT